MTGGGVRQTLCTKHTDAFRFLGGFVTQRQRGRQGERRQRNRDYIKDTAFGLCSFPCRLSCAVQRSAELRGQSHAWLAGGTRAMHEERRLQRASTGHRLSRGRRFVEEVKCRVYILPQVKTVEKKIAVCSLGVEAEMCEHLTAEELDEGRRCCWVRGDAARHSCLTCET